MITDRQYDLAVHDALHGGGAAPDEDARPV